MFLTSTAPASLEVYRRNRFYKSDEEYVFAIAEAMRVEYEAIVAAGLILQVDDAWLPALWDRIGIGMGLEAFRARCAMRIEALNHALRNIPEDRVRYHLCWGSWHGPHAFDLELDRIVDLMLKVKAQAYLIEAANARHEHEVAVWEKVKLPAGKILIPGVVTHSTDVVEHPELVSQRSAALRAPGRQGERHRRHRLRLWRPFASADRLGETAFAGRRRGAGEQSARLRAVADRPARALGSRPQSAATTGENCVRSCPLRRDRLHPKRPTQRPAHKGGNHARIGVSEICRRVRRRNPRCRLPARTRRTPTRSALPPR